jgi:type II secretory pathway pseudopilin PulG
VTTLCADVCTPQVRPRVPCGFGLVELIVAMTLLSVALLGLAASAVVALQSLNEADNLAEASREVAVTIDSLLLAAPTGEGERTAGGIRVRWRAAGDSLLYRINLEVDQPGAAAGVRRTYSAARLREPGS